MAAEKSLPFHFPRKHIKDNKIKPTIIIRTALLSAKKRAEKQRKTVSKCSNPLRQGIFQGIVTEPYFSIPQQTLDNRLGNSSSDTLPRSARIKPGKIKNSFLTFRQIQMMW
jgi:hypothetical protein